MTAAALILAAGASRRMGQPKQLARLGEETLLERTVRVCTEAGLSPIVVVLGASAEDIVRRTSLSGATVVVNEEWIEGMASSIRCGVRSLPEACDGCVILTCDMPAVTASHLSQLAACSEMTASAYAGRQGVPAYFPKASLSALLDLRGDTGARAILAQAPAIEISGGDLDIDTADDLERARLIFS
jgi:CTP:molybdopterin cytidylyltransferase MocA